MLVWFFAILCILALCPVPLILESSVAYFFEATQPLSTRSDTTWVQVEPESCNVSRLSLLVGHGSFCCTFGLWKMIYLLCTERFNNSKGFTCNMCCNLITFVHYIHSIFSNWQCSCLSEIGKLVIYRHVSPNLRPQKVLCQLVFLSSGSQKIATICAMNLHLLHFNPLWMRRVVHQAKARCQMSGVKSFT